MIASITGVQSPLNFLLFLSSYGRISLFEVVINTYLSEVTVDAQK
jgi:hypothetical protein